MDYVGKNTLVEFSIWVSKNLFLFQVHFTVVTNNTATKKLDFNDLHDNYVINIIIILHITVVSKIFAGCNFREFCDKGRVRENLFAKFNMGGYKMAAFVKTDFH